MAKKKPVTQPDEIVEIGRDELIAAVQETFHSPSGQIVLGWLSSKFGFIRSTTHIPGDPHGSSVNEGMRLVCVEIGKLLESDPGGDNPNTVEM
mgnify:CR=1 FL=1